MTVKWSPSSPSTLYSAALDGSIACLDLRSGGAVSATTAPPVPAGEVAHLTEAAELAARSSKMITPPITALGVGCGGSMLAVGSGTQVRFYDVRKLSASAEWPLLGGYTESHSECITNLLFHPHLTSTLLSADEAGLINVYNTAVSGEADALSGSITADGGVSSMGVFGPQGSCVYATTQSVSLQLWNLGSGESMTHHPNLSLTFMQAGLDCSFLIDCTYDAASQALSLWAGSHSGALHAFDVQHAGLRHMQAMTGGHTDDVRCLARAQPAGAGAPLFVSGAEDGSLATWSAAPPPQAATEATALPLMGLAQAAAGGKSSRSRKQGRKHSHKHSKTRSAGAPY